MPQTAIILFAHGSRDPLWHRPIEAVARQIEAISPEAPVCCAYLELSSPSLPDAVLRLLDTGVERIRILPLFLGVGRHAREDLPLLLRDLQARHPKTDFELLAAVGEHPDMTRLMAEIALQGLA
jgi:sirohydrochlorin cobaltochelatase